MEFDLGSSAVTTQREPLATGDRSRSWSQKLIVRLGKRLTRALDSLFAKQSLVGNPPVFDPSLFPFIETFEANWQEILREVRPILDRREEVPPFHAVSPDQYRISTGDSWRTLFLYAFGCKLKRNCERCPETVRLLEAVPNMRTAWISIVGPHYHIPAHLGPTKGVVVFHLALVVPRDAEKCTIRVGNEIRRWQLGRCIAFDDSYEHEVRNDTDEERVVLIWHADRPMRWLGRVVRKLFMAGIRLSAYTQDILRNSAEWADRREQALVQKTTASEPKGHRTG